MGSVDDNLFEPPASGRDCGVAVDTQPRSACRLRQTESIAAIRAQLEQGHAIQRDGDALLIAYRGDAREVLMAGGLTFALSPIPGSDLWFLRLRIPDLDQFVLSFRFLRDGARPSLEVDPIRWRGPHAPSPSPVAHEIQGTFRDTAINSAALAGERRVSIYEPPPVDAQPLVATIYVADGKLLRFFAAALEPAIASRRIPRVRLIGLHAADGPGRGQEYVRALGARSGAFDRHQAFFLEDVIPWAERVQQAPGSRPAPRWLLGTSNGADWAIETGLRHPGMFRCIIAFSPSWPVDSKRVAAASGHDLAMVLASGTLETEFHENTRAIAEVLDANGLRHQHHEWVAGHEMDMWVESVPVAVRHCLDDTGTRRTVDSNPASH